MTGKRFTHKDLHYMSMNETLDSLNELSEENEQLKKENSKHIMDYNGLNCEYGWLKEENEQLKQLLTEVEHELTSLTGLSAFDKCASQLGYVEVFDEDYWELDYSEILKKIDKMKGDVEMTKQTGNFGVDIKAKLHSETEINEKADLKNESITPSFFMSDIMKVLSELECEIWDNHVPKDKVKMQNMIVYLKSELISISKNNRDIITIGGYKYKRCYE